MKRIDYILVGAMVFSLYMSNFMQGDNAKIDDTWMWISLGVGAIIVTRVLGPIGGKK